MARTFTSLPTTLVVQAPPSLGKGSDAGSFNNDIWTPGRDAAGVVNEVSWALVPKGRWVSVAGTRLDALDSLVKAAVPGWEDYSHSRWVGVTNAWNSPAMDPANARAWYISSGGHNDSSNNGIYRFDGFKMAYAIERLPSNSTRWSARYKAAGTMTVCSESQEAMAAAVAAGTWSRKNDWFYDEIYWDNPAVDTSSGDVGVPTARHVYHGVLYIPELNELVMASRRVWRYSLTTGKYTLKSAPGRSSPAGGDGGMEEECIAIYDESRSLLMMTSAGSPGPWGGSFDMNTNSWTSYVPPGRGWEWQYAVPFRSGNEVTLVRTPNPGGSDSPTGQYLRYNIVTRATITSGYPQFAGGLSASSFVNGYDGQGGVFIPTLNQYWITARMTTGAYEWVELDTTTSGGWTFKPKIFANAPPTPIHCSHAMYVPSMDAVLWLGRGDENIRIYKV